MLYRSSKQYILLGLGKNKFKGHYGPFLHAVDEKKIDAILGIYIQNGGKNGQITFGGIDEGHAKMDTAVTGPLMDHRKYIVKMKKLMLGKTEMCKEEDDSCKALIDTGCRSILGPSGIVTKFLKDVLGKLPN